MNEITKVIIYCRVSSKKQVNDGNGLDSQEQICRTWARQRNKTVERVFYEKGISGSEADRPAFKEMIAFLVDTKERYIVLALDINRFARDTVVYGALRDKIRKLGHSMQTVNMTLEETEESELLENVSASLGQYERKKNAKRTKMNMMEQAKLGFWVMRSPMGLKEVRIKNRMHHIRKEPDAEYIKEALVGYANDKFKTQKDVFDYLCDKKLTLYNDNRPVRLTMNTVKNILRNEKYTGCFAYPHWDIPYQKWCIEPLIDRETYQRIQDKLNGKNTIKERKYNTQDEQYPLRRWVRCAECGHKMTASAPRSKSGKPHYYYNCYNKNCPKCGVVIRVADMHSDFENILSTLTPVKELAGATAELTIQIYNELTADIQARISASQAEIKKLEQEKEKVFITLTQSIDAPEVAQMCKERIAELNARIQQAKDKKTDIEPAPMSMSDAINSVIGFIHNPLALWQNGTYTDRQGVLNLCFSEPMSYDKAEKFRTPKLSPIFAVFNKNLGDSERWRAQKDSNPQPSDP